MKLRIVFLESIFHGKAWLSANSCRVPPRHLRCFKTWNNEFLACPKPGKTTQFCRLLPLSPRHNAGENRAEGNCVYVLAWVQVPRGSCAPLYPTAVSLTSKLNTHQTRWSPQTCWMERGIKCCCQMETVLLLDLRRKKRHYFQFVLNLKYLNSYKWSFGVLTGFGMLKYNWENRAVLSFELCSDLHYNYFPVVQLLYIHENTIER